jgi:hypothetical protein
VKTGADRIRWAPVLARAAEIVRSYTIGVTLRQLFYRLVSLLLIPNAQYYYAHLSELTARARRDDAFPDLIDLRRSIHRRLAFDGPRDALRWLRQVYGLDRTLGQPVSLYIGLEKEGLRGLLTSWFDPLGIPIVPTSGYASQSFVKEVQQDITRQGRPAVLLNASDFDPSGEDIERDFVERVGLFDRVERVALTEAQVLTHDLPPMLGKATDSRASAFLARYGRLVQVELDALPVDVLQGLFQTAIDREWDTSEYRRVLAREARDRQRLPRR